MDQSRLASEHEAERSRRANRRLRILLGGVAAALAIAIAAGILALEQRGDARDAALVADAQRLGAEALTEERLDNAFLLARAGVDLDDSTATRSNLLSVLLRNPPVLGVLRGAGWPLYAVAVSPDQRLVALGDERGGVEVFDAATREPIGNYGLENGLVQNLTFSPDSRTLAVAGHSPQDEPPGALVDLIDPRTSERRHRFVLPPDPRARAPIIAHVAFLPNGRDLVVQQTPFTFPDAPGSLLRRLNGTTGQVEGHPLRVGRSAAFGVFATGDRRRLFVSNPKEKATYEIDAERLRVLRRHPVGDFGGNVSPDGDLFALGSDEGRVRVLDLRSGEVRRFRGRHDGEIQRMEFTPDARTLVSSGGGDVIVWDVARGELRERLAAHSGEIHGLDISADGRTLYSGALDALAVIWDLRGDRRLVRRFDAGPPFVVPNDEYPKGIAASPDGRTLAVSQSDGTLDLFDTGTLHRRASVRALDGFAAAVAYSSDGRVLAVTGDGGRITLWDARTLRPAGELTGLRTTSQALAFSPDGELVAAAELGEPTPDGFVGSAVRVWNARTRAATGVSFEVTAPSIAFSHDGKLLAAAGFEAPTEVRDARTGERIATLRTEDSGRTVAFSPDGELLATGLYNGRVQLWSTKSWEPVAAPLEAHGGRVTALEFSGDGHVLMSAGGDGTVLLHDVETQKRIGSPLTVGRKSRDAFLSAVLAPDDSHLFAVSAQGPGVRLDMSPDSWKRHACLVAGRELTRDEWEERVPDRSYRPVCGG